MRLTFLAASLICSSLSAFLDLACGLPLGLFALTGFPLFAFFVLLPLAAGLDLRLPPVGFAPFAAGLSLLILLECAVLTG